MNNHLILLGEYKMKTEHNYIPQLKLRTNLVAGASVEACMNNLDHWRKQLEQKCAKKSAGYTPSQETEMKWWQAGTV